MARARDEIARLRQRHAKISSPTANDDQRPIGSEWGLKEDPDAFLRADDDLSQTLTVASRRPTRADHLVDFAHVFAAEQVCNRLT
jgi:hypothetical protein